MVGSGGLPHCVAVPFSDVCWRRIKPVFNSDADEQQARQLLNHHSCDAAHVLACDDFVYILGHWNRSSDISSTAISLDHRPTPPSVIASSKGAGGKKASLPSHVFNNNTNLLSPAPTNLNSVLRLCLRTLTCTKQTLSGDAPSARLTNYAFVYDYTIGKAYVHGGFYLGTSSSCNNNDNEAGGDTSAASAVDGQVSSDLYELSLRTLTWRRFTPKLPSSHNNNADENNNVEMADLTSSSDADAATTAPPPARFCHSVSIYERILYLFGGISLPSAMPFSHCDSVAAYNNTTSGPKKTHQFMTNPNDILHMPRLHNDVLAFDIDKLSWKRVATAGTCRPAARQAHAACLLRRAGQPTKLIIHGGSTPHHMLNDIFSLDLGGGGSSSFKWQEVKRDTRSAEAFIHKENNDNISDDNSNNNKQLHTATYHITDPSGKSRHRVAIIGAKMFVFGGIRLKTRAELDEDLYNNNSNNKTGGGIDNMTRYVPLNELCVYDFDLNVWTISTPASYGRTRWPAIVSPPPGELAAAGTTAAENSAPHGKSGNFAVAAEITKALNNTASNNNTTSGSVMDNDWPICSDFAAVPCVDIIQHSFRLYAVCGSDIERCFFQADIGRPPAPSLLRFVSVTYDNTEIEWTTVPNADDYLIQLQLLAMNDESSPLHTLKTVPTTTTATAPAGAKATSSNVAVQLPPAANLMAKSNTNFVPPTVRQPPPPSNENLNNSIPPSIKSSSRIINNIEHIPYFLRPRRDDELVDADSCIGLTLAADGNLQAIAADNSGLAAYAQICMPKEPVASFNLPTRPASCWYDVAIVDRNSNRFVVDSYLVPEVAGGSSGGAPFTEHVPDYRTKTVLTRIYGLYGIHTLSLTRLQPNIMFKLRVCAINGCGRSGFTNEVLTKTHMRGVPPPPANVQVKHHHSNGGISITWDNVTENGPIHHYTVFLVANNPNAVASESTPVTSIVYEGPETRAFISSEQLKRAFIETIQGKPSITFRVTAHNDAMMGGQAVQIRWLYTGAGDLRVASSGGGGGDNNSNNNISMPISAQQQMLPPPPAMMLSNSKNSGGGGSAATTTTRPAAIFNSAVTAARRRLSASSSSGGGRQRDNNSASSIGSGNNSASGAGDSRYVAASSSIVLQQHAGDYNNIAPQQSQTFFSLVPPHYQAVLPPPPSPVAMPSSALSPFSLSASRLPIKSLFIDSGGDAVSEQQSAPSLTTLLTSDVGNSSTGAERSRTNSPPQSSCQSIFRPPAKGSGRNSISVATDIGGKGATSSSSSSGSSAARNIPRMPLFRSATTTASTSSSSSSACSSPAAAVAAAAAAAVVAQPLPADAEAESNKEAKHSTTPRLFPPPAARRKSASKSPSPGGGGGSNVMISMPAALPPVGSAFAVRSSNPKYSLTGGERAKPKRGSFLPPSTTADSSSTTTSATATTATSTSTTTATTSSSSVKTPLFTSKR